MSAFGSLIFVGGKDPPARARRRVAELNRRPADQDPSLYLSLLPVVHGQAVATRITHQP